jgi:hypothetical protein
MPKIVEWVKVKCFNCQKEHDKKITAVKERNFCSMVCYRAKIKEIMNLDHIKEKAGSANRGKKFSEDRIKKMHGHRTVESYIHFPSEETRKNIGEKSSKKFTPEFKAKLRETMVSKGHWVSYDDKDEWLVYKDISNWKHRMFDIVEFESTKNPVRDHIFPRLSGFELGVFPEILRHVVNCGIISRSENISKGFVDRKKSLEQKNIALSELFEKIKLYCGDWAEHEIALKKIEDYMNGKRWQKYL